MTPSYETVERRYWEMHDVAADLCEEPSCIRFWLREFRINIKRDHKGNRKFTAKDMWLLREVHRLMRQSGYTLNGVRRILLEKGLIPAQKFRPGRPRKYGEEIDNMMRVIS